MSLSRGTVPLDKTVTTSFSFCFRMGTLSPSRMAHSPRARRYVNMTIKTLKQLLQKKKAIQVMIIDDKLPGILFKFCDLNKES
jgi:hypothetical protein